MGVRLRLYGCERMRRERLIGEAVVSFANINLELENNFWLNLESRVSATVSSLHIPERIELKQRTNLKLMTLQLHIVRLKKDHLLSS